MFSPAANQVIEIGTERYRFAEHPAAPGMPYGQEGRAAVVYKLALVEVHAEGPLELTRADGGPPITLVPARPLTLGRAPENAVRFASTGVSRLHATLELRDGSLFILDNRSSNKTFVNDAPIAPETWVELPPGSRVQLGTEASAGFRLPLVHSRCRALKVFKPNFRVPAMVSLTERLSPFATIEGMGVCARTVLTPQAHGPLLQQFDDLVYAVCMGWVEGPTWMEVVLDQRPLALADALRLAMGFASIMSRLEQKGIAHCDISGPNIIIPALADEPETGAPPVALVDVEQMHAPGLDRPDAVPGGSAGYAPRSVPDGGLWGADADRFGGAVAIAEMLGWADEQVRAGAWGESYFEPSETQTPCARYDTLSRSLAWAWGDSVARLLDRAWRAERLGQCPTFGEWLVALSGCNADSVQAPTLTPSAPPTPAPVPFAPPTPKAVTPPTAPEAVSPPPAPVSVTPQEVVSVARARHSSESEVPLSRETRLMRASNPPVPAPIPHIAEAAPAADLCHAAPAPPAVDDGMSKQMTAALNRARDAEDRGDLQGALEAYCEAQQQAHDEASRVEFGLIIRQLERKSSSVSYAASTPTAEPDASSRVAVDPMPLAPTPSPSVESPVASRNVAPDPELLRRVRELEGLDREPKNRTPEAPPPYRRGAYILLAVVALVLIAAIVFAVRRQRHSMEMRPVRHPMVACRIERALSSRFVHPIL